MEDELDDVDECMALELASLRAGGGVTPHVRISSRCRAHLFHRYFRR